MGKFFISFICPFPVWIKTERIYGFLPFLAAIEDDKDNFENDVRDYVAKFRTSGDILNFNAKTATDEQIQAYNSLRQLATDYGTAVAP